MSEEDLALEALTEFFNAVEAGIAAARQRIKAMLNALPKERSGSSQQRISRLPTASSASSVEPPKT